MMMLHLIGCIGMAIFFFFLGFVAASAKCLKARIQ